jgi:hypothetical protein
MKPKLKLPGTQRLKLKCDILLSNFAFKFNLRRYIEAREKAAHLQWQLEQESRKTDHLGRKTDTSLMSSLGASGLVPRCTTFFGTPPSVTALIRIFVYFRLPGSVINELESTLSNTLGVDGVHGGGHSSDDVDSMVYTVQRLVTRLQTELQASKAGSHARPLFSSN